MHSPILQPVVALVAWSLVMWAWLYATRIPALRASNVDIVRKVGGTGANLDAILPPEVQWKAQNYNHLMEQPTLFYAVCLVIAMLGLGERYALWTAWAYVALRVAHSIVQATVNRVIVRFALFAAASLCLIALTVRAALALF